ncbi:MAG: polyhydroxyalkanoate depolymerase [Bdellovibrionales bacterium]
MIFYPLHEAQRAAMMPLRMAAVAAQVALHHPFFPGFGSTPERAAVAGAEIFERAMRDFNKPSFGFGTTETDGREVAVSEEVVWNKPFCQLLHFQREGCAARRDPRVLIVAPMSCHHATLLRGTVEAMLPDHDVYITDWADAKLVPLAEGAFDLDDYIDYVSELLRFLGPDTHVVAVCQPSVPALCAVALMAAAGDAAQPRSLTLMGGPIDPRRAPTAMTQAIAAMPLEWFKSMVVEAVPFSYPGALRMVYPGFLQLQGFMAMNPDRHAHEHLRLFNSLVAGDAEAALTHRKFYDEYLAVMDVTAEFYLQTVERVFQRFDLPRGAFVSRGRKVEPQAIRKTALMVMEGEHDDISAPGQALPALELCSGLPESMKAYYLQKGVGHFGLFSGKLWRGEALPKLRAFMREH